MARELELKYSSLEGRVPDQHELATALGGLGLLVRHVGTRHQVDVYFDDASQALERQALALRVRTVGGQSVAAVKGRGNAVAGVFEREELEAPMALGFEAGQFEALAWPRPVADRLSGIVDLAELGPSLEIATTREVFDLERDGLKMAELSFDEVTCRPPHPGAEDALIQAAEFSEVEVEACPGTTEHELRAIGDALEALTPLVFGNVSKLERATSLLSPFL